MPKTESSRDKILRYIHRSGSATGPELAKHLEISRQAVSLHLRRLLADKEIIKTGSTKAARYLPKDASPGERKFKRDFLLDGLDESAVYDQAALLLNLSQLRGNVESILHYAFTEILNNAIDHSMAESCNVGIRRDAARVAFSVRDKGIGVFHSIATKFGLEEEHLAMIELVKGKTTTKPDTHSGEGIFFVSRAADRFRLRSHRLQIEWDNDVDDVFVTDSRFLKGTLAEFEIRTSSATRLENVFERFAPEKYDYRFAKTHVFVKLLQEDYVSRSEAKRLLHNLDKFSEIELDMKNVRHVGQGFADEVFRVFAANNPDVVVRAINTGRAVDAMIRHVSDETDAG